MNKFLKSKKKNSIILVLIVTMIFTACGKDKTSSSNTSANNSVSSFDSVVTSSSAETSITETSVTTPPEGTTTAPSVTTQTPPQTTAPKVTTKAPTTTRAPQVTTQAPVTTTAPQKQLIVPNAAQCAVIENEIMRLVNEYRASLGITPYGIEPKIIEAARIRAKESATKGYYGHTRPNGTSFSTVFTEVGYSSGGASAENLTGFTNHIIGQNYFTCTDAELKKVAQEMFNGWKASPDHNKNMINTTRTKMGVGVYSVKKAMTNGEIAVFFYGIQLFTLT